MSWGKKKKVADARVMHVARVGCLRALPVCRPGGGGGMSYRTARLAATHAAWVEWDGVSAAERAESWRGGGREGDCRYLE